MDIVHVGHHEIWVVLFSTTLVEIGKVDEVPAALEGVAFSLDIVCESGTLSEWVVTFLHDFGVAVFQCCKHGES